MPRGNYINGDPRIQPPSRALRMVLVSLVAIWLSFAVSINWASSPETLFLLLTGDAERSRVARFGLFTAPVMHDPIGSSGVDHILSTVIGLFFLALALETDSG